jgi:hypothetical protein
LKNGKGSDASEIVPNAAVGVVRALIQLKQFAGKLNIIHVGHFLTGGL